MVWRVSGGRVISRVVGMPILELATIGGKSGEERLVLLNYFEYEGGFVVIASNAGDDRVPAWWLNLASNPDATVTIGGEPVPVRAREANGEERDSLWDHATRANPGYADYATYTDRPIPVVVLERR